MPIDKSGRVFLVGSVPLLHPEASDAARTHRRQYGQVPLEPTEPANLSGRPTTRPDTADTQWTELQATRGRNKPQLRLIRNVSI